ncbi:hypothetical protein TRFO_10889 [Tritrichomonas foetus]|uniref:Anaphase-promoting complex subunit 4-like WD40 domain-containing protein n=1 Tax=Tritrichomonas foetus TaxID=1144522 RepID=A0A1J4JBV5_9EUKA|nr:hypothetical protein TRFO_10889 [Tritrichomonas foetus]|eukprot:OHS94740.1 hypothetical protein TRFO_10889 [Tritrichomonas foetus]
MTNKISLTALPFPHEGFNSCCIDWGSCGLVALAAKNSILLYSINKQNILFKRFIDIESSITCLKFHPEKPLLAVADESSLLFIYDCETCQIIGKKMTTNEKKNITSLQWKGDILLGLVPNHYLLGFDVSENSPSLIYKVEFSHEFERIAVDPFNNFRILLWSPSLLSFSIVQSTNSRLAPEPPTNTEEISGTNKILDIIFHPHIPDVLIMVLSKSIIAYELQTKSTLTILSDETSLSNFCQIAISNHNHKNLLLYYSNSTVSVYQMQPKSFIKSGQIHIRRDTKDNFGVIVASPVFSRYFLCYSISNGLTLIRITDKGMPVIKQVASIYPCHFSAFDTIDTLLAAGTTNGKIFIFDATKNETKMLLSIGIENTKLNMFRSNNESNMKSKNNYFSISYMKFINNNELLWSTSNQSGLINLKNRTIKKFERRLGSVQFFYSSPEIGLAVHNQQTLSVVNGNTERIIILDSSIISAAAQINRTPATCFNGDCPNFALLLNNREINIFNIRSSHPVLRLRIQDDIETPTAIAWKGDNLVFSDNDGILISYDFNYGVSSRILALPQIKKIVFEYGEGNTAILLTKTGKLGICDISKKKVEPFLGNIHDFTLFNEKDLFLILNNGSMKVISYYMSKSKNKYKIKSVTHLKEPIDSLSTRLNSLSLQILALEGENKTPKQISKICALNCFLFDSNLWRVVDRYFGGQKELSLRFSHYGKTEEIRKQNIFKENFIDVNNNSQNKSKNSIFAVFMKAKIGDFERVSQMLLETDPDSDQYVVSCIAGALMMNGIDENSKELLKSVAVSLFAKNKYIEGTFLLLLCKLDSLAAQYLQDTELWEQSLDILKSIQITPLIDVKTDNQAGIPDENEINDAKNSKDGERNKKVIDLIRKSAEHFVASSLKEKAALIFASIGDFHPVLSLLVQKKRYVLAFHLMMFLDSLEALKPYDGRDKNFFGNLDEIRQKIVEESSIYISSH